MAVSADLIEQSAAIVVRARAGDQNALATILKVGESARAGGSRAMAAFNTIKHYIEAHPATEFVLGADAPAVMDTPDAPIVKAPDPELRKPTLPQGIFDRIFDPEYFALCIIRACGYRHGLPAAATILAAGPPLTAPVIAHIGNSQFQSDESTATFFHGVRFCGEDNWRQIAPQLDPPLRRCLAIGQCVGRARKLQMVRQPGSRIGAYSEVAGWELGES